MKSNDEVETRNDELKSFCLYFRVHRSYFIVNFHSGQIALRASLRLRLT
jgi:hypothetical protein